jgi:hypothetical protein
MPSLGVGGFKQIVLGALLPLIFAGLIVVGLRRYRPALALVVLAIVCAGVAEYSYASRDACTYCAERNLLPLAPITVVLIALGLNALLTMRGRKFMILGIAGVALVLAGVGQRTRIELKRFANVSYFLDTANRVMLSHLPKGGGAVAIEGYGASVFAQAEQPLVYHLVNERAPGRASIILGSALGNAIQYLDFNVVVQPPGPEFDPKYRYVLTRLAGVATARQMIARGGGIALQRRVAPLDVIPSAGLGVPYERVDRSGVPWVQATEPLQFEIAGRNGGRPVWARLSFRTSGPVSVPSQPGVRARLRGRTLIACVRATGSEPVRQAALRIKATLYPGIPPRETFPPPMPLEGLALTAMRAVSDRCTV